MTQAVAHDIIDPMIGCVVANRYEVVRLIDRGGMGAVYEVRHRHLKRSFAMKTLAPELSRQPEALARFRREAEIIAGLRHPNIIDVVDWDTLYDGSPCMVMELLHGEDLWDRLERRGPLSWRDIARIGDQILSALVVAHRAGVVHRDIKPQNIFLHVDDSGDEHAMLLDFGVSKLRHNQTLAGTDTRLLGTPIYMAPEQVDGQGTEVGPAADVWAMGAILYEIATGEEAFGADTLPSILYRVCHHTPTRIADLRPDVPPRFARLIELTLSRDPGQRIQSAKQLRAGLRAALNRKYLRSLRQRDVVETSAPAAEPPAGFGTQRTECVHGVVPMAYRAALDGREPRDTIVAGVVDSHITTLAYGTNHRGRLDSEALRAPAGRRRDPVVLLAGVLAVITLILLAAWLSPDNPTGDWPPPAPAPSEAQPVAPPEIRSPDLLIELPARPSAPDWSQLVFPSEIIGPWGAWTNTEPTPPPKAARVDKARGKNRAKPPRRKRAKRPPRTTPSDALLPYEATALPKRPDNDQVSERTQALKRAARACRKRSGDMVPEVRLHLRIRPTGALEGWIEGGGPAFQNCLSDVIHHERMRFERSRDGLTLTPRLSLGER